MTKAREKLRSLLQWDHLDTVVGAAAMLLLGIVLLGLYGAVQLQAAMSSPLAVIAGCLIFVWACGHAGTQSMALRRFPLFTPQMLEASTKSLYGTAGLAIVGIIGNIKACFYFTMALVVTLGMVAYVVPEFSLALLGVFAQRAAE